MRSTTTAAMMAAVASMHVLDSGKTSCKWITSTEIRLKIAGARMKKRKASRKARRVNR